MPSVCCLRVYSRFEIAFFPDLDKNSKKNEFSFIIKEFYFLVRQYNNPIQIAQQQVNK